MLNINSSYIQDGNVSIVTPIPVRSVTVNAASKGGSEDLAEAEEVKKRSAKQDGSVVGNKIAKK